MLAAVKARRFPCRRFAAAAGEGMFFGPEGPRLGKPSVHVLQNAGNRDLADELREPALPPTPAGWNSQTRRRV